MKRILIDNMIVDLIMGAPGLLDSIRAASDRGGLVILTTHILHDQLTATDNVDRRNRLLATYEALPKEHVETHGIVTDISNLGGAQFENDAESGVSVRTVKTGGRGGWHDALMATTASGDADVLVTEDGPLAKKARAAGVNCAIWTFQEFVAFVQAEIREG